MANDSESLDPVASYQPPVQLDPLCSGATPTQQQPTRAGDIAAAPGQLPSVPGYKILEELGRGGGVVVYRARELALERIVALKIFLAGAHAGATELESFRTQAEAVARLQHPNIVQILQVGEYQGLPYVVMEFCAGGPLTSKLCGQRFNPRQAAALVRMLAYAASAAHECQVVHRDLKPDNILLAVASGQRPATSKDNEATSSPTTDNWPLTTVLKITGFGLHSILAESRLASSGVILGTPQYMAPEQVRGGAQTGPATDIYALGVLFYEMLTGRPPLGGTSDIDTLLQVITQEPTPPRQPFPHIPRDLELICLKCLQKEPSQRYPSAAFLAEDLRRFLAGETIMVQPSSWLEPVRRWFELYPNRWITGFLVLVIVALLFVVRDLAVEADRWASEYRAVATMNKAIAVLGDSGMRAKIAIMRQQIAQAEDRLRTAQLMRVDALVLRDPWQALQILHDQSVFPAGQRDPAWYFHDDLCKRGTQILSTRGVGLPCVAFSQKGQLLAAGGREGAVRLWDASTLHERDLPRIHTKRVLVLAWNQGDTRLASAGDDGLIVLWHPAAGKRLVTLEGHKGRVAGLGWHPDGKTLASSGADGTVRLWDTGRAQEQSSWSAGKMLLALAWSPAGTTLATAGDHTIQLWDPATRQLRMVLDGHTDIVHDLAFSSDGHTLASGSGDGTVRLWNVTSGKLQATLRGHSGGASAVAWHPGGVLFASAGGDNTVRVWNTATGQEQVILRGLPKPATSLSWNHDGITLAVSSYESPAIHLWQPAPAPERFTLTRQLFGTVGLDATGRMLAIVVDQQTTRVLDRKTGEALAELRAGPPAAVSPDGKWRAVAQGGSVKVEDAANQRLHATLSAHGSEVTALLWSTDNRTLATALVDGTIRLWHATTGEARAVLRGHTERVTALAWSTAGDFLVSRSSDGTIQLWQVGAVPE